MSPAPDCPFCGAGAVERVGQWGGQIITAQWRCDACNSYFEAVRDDFADEEPADPRYAASRTDSSERK
jgi:transposase-like protein